MSFIDDASYEFQLKMFQWGLRSTPPIVQPVASVAGAEEIAKQVDKLEIDYSRTNNISTGFSTSLNDMGKFVTGNLPIILISIIVIYFIVKKELKIA